MSESLKIGLVVVYGLGVLVVAAFGLWAVYEKWRKKKP